MKKVILVIALLGLFVVNLAVASTPAVFLPLVSRGSVSARPWQQIVIPDYGSLDVWVRDTAIAWYGKVGLDTNYTDLRLGYNDLELYVQFLVFDRLLYSSDRVDFTFGSYRVESTLGYTHSLYHNGVLIPDNMIVSTVWRGSTGVNTPTDQWGWWTEIHIPWSNLGGKPALGTALPMQALTHNQNGSESSLSSVLVFGLPYTDRTESYTRPNVSSSQIITVANQQNGTVLDAVVGGGTLCGDPAIALAVQQNTSVFATWGGYNWQTQYTDFPIDYLTLQSQQDVADWTCFSKVLGQFPLPIPSGKKIVSATLTLANYGHSGYPTQEKLNVLGQVFELDKPVDPTTVTWNNAPAPRKAIDAKWIPLIDNVTIFPHNPITWDVSAAVARAYSEGRPFEYMLYDSDTNISSGEYFDSSRWTWQPSNLPTLTVVYGN